MTIHIKISAVVVVIVLLGLPVAPASEPNDNIPVLDFDLVQTALGPFRATRMQQDGWPPLRAFAVRKPPYAAGISFEGPTDYLTRPGPAGPPMSEFSLFALGEAMGMSRAETSHALSTAQKEFLRAAAELLNNDGMGSLPIPQWYQSPDEPNSPKRLLLYAMTLDDAKAMAGAYAELTLARWRRDVDGLKGDIKESEGRIAAAQERMRELEKVIEDSEQTLNSLKQKLPYRTEKEAMEAIAELDRMLNAAQVDIAGIQSKIKAVQDYLRSGELRLDEAIRAKLQAMFVEESIALQGAEARKKMATQLRTDANRFLDVQQSFVEARRQRPAMEQTIVGLQEKVSKARSRLESVMAERPEIADHPVTIYPVRWLTEREDDPMGGGRP